MASFVADQRQIDMRGPCGCGGSTVSGRQAGKNWRGKQSIAWVVDLTKGPTYFVLTFDQIFVDLTTQDPPRG